MGLVPGQDLFQLAKSLPTQMYFIRQRWGFGYACSSNVSLSALGQEQMDILVRKY